MKKKIFAGVILTNLLFPTHLQAETLEKICINILETEKPYLITHERHFYHIEKDGKYFYITDKKPFGKLEKNDSYFVSDK